MLHEKYKNHKFILASKSPRRRNLLKALNVDFEVCTDFEVDEAFPETLRNQDIAIYLAELKSKAFNRELKDNEILITADTIVVHNNTVINKPDDQEEAFKMLKTLSGSMHTVYTGVCIKSGNKSVSFYSETEVFFRKLESEEIRYYVETFKPLDKAGAYGIQEWIGYVGIEKINGSYFNVMGLPVQKLYSELCKL